MRSLLPPGNGARDRASAFCNVDPGLRSGIGERRWEKTYGRLKIGGRKEELRPLCERGRRKPVASHA